MITDDKPVKQYEKCDLRDGAARLGGNQRTRLREARPVHRPEKDSRPADSPGRRTRFGRDHALAPLSGKPFPILYREFRQRVPIRTYADFWRDYFSAGYREEGEKRSLNLTDVTWPGKVPFFCETSGTTAPTKFIPFTHEMFAANRRAALDMTACYLARNRATAG